MRPVSRLAPRKRAICWLRPGQRWPTICSKGSRISARSRSKSGPATWVGTASTCLLYTSVLLLNTCSIREKAQEKVFHQLGRWKKLKAKKPGLVIGVGGCVASQEGENLRSRAPYVDIVFGPQTLHRLPTMIKQVQEGRGAQVDIAFPEIEKFDNLPEPRAEGATAFVSIMEGLSLIHI